jgi:hypothetical protein
MTDEEFWHNEFEKSDAELREMASQRNELLEACKSALIELQYHIKDECGNTLACVERTVLEIQAAIARAESTGCASRDCGTSVPALNRATNPLKEP